MIIEQALIGGAIELQTLDSGNISQDYVSWLNDPEVSRYLESRFKDHTQGSVEAFIENCNKSDASILLGIFYESRHIGNIKADLNFHHKTAGIGLMIGERGLQGQGIGSSAITMLGDYLFKNHDIFKINAGIYQSNFPSVKAFEKAGYEVEYVKHDHIINVEGEREDVIMMVKYAD
ncbi:MAG: GNAT family N-acetyltransferase [Micavibrio sp.]|nr:GNAT family N-acetyltransferase [Micavibrio sp.]